MIDKTISNRYKLSEELISGPLNVLYKAQDLHDNKHVFLSLLSEKSLSRPLEALLRFKRNVEQRSKIKHPNLLEILSVLELDNQTCLVYEDFASQVLSSYLGQPGNISQPMNTDQAVDLVMQIASALSAAHEHNLLHQAIQPANILVSASQPQVAKLFNFGYSILKDISKITDKDEIIATFGYLSPESSGILRKPIDARSDIYSLGILFYQLLTGRIPYIADDISSLIHQHIATKPVSPSKLNKTIPPVIDNIVLRLIAKDPQERYQSLSGLIFDLMEYQGRRAQGEELVDFEIARTDRLAQLSFSTKLIGRDKELSGLNELLNKTIQGHGSLAFVFGEPGIGKSRLVDELRGSIHSLNGLFCGGKCYQYEFRTPYKVFSEAIDAYIEKVKRLSQKEQEIHIKSIKDSLGELAGEIVKISPAITDLIGIPPKPVELEPEKEKIRFLVTVTNFLVSLSTPQSPLLMFLDDLQWADEGSLEILGRFAEKIHDSSVLLIVSYRDTEVGSGHPLAQLIKALKERQVFLSEIPVRSLDVNGTSQMISQIIMEKEEGVLPLARELNERAKGNPFFTLELLHSLVDSGVIFLKDDRYIYDLDKLKSAALPTTIVEAVLKRMKDLAEEAVKILSYASVMGREIKFELLTELSNRPVDQVLVSIENGIQNQLLYRDITGDENVFFMHDRIREAFYERVPSEEKGPLHKHIAEVLEEQNKADLGAVLYDLAYHFTQGKVEERALHYSIRAGHKAQESYANTLAINLYNTAREMFENKNAISAPEYLEVLESLGEVYRLAGRFDDSIKTFKKCESMIPASDKVRRVKVLSGMGDAHLGKGENENCARALESALTILGVWIPRTFMGVGLGIMKELSTHVLHGTFPGVFVKTKYREDQLKLTRVKICSTLARVNFLLDMNKAFYFILEAANIGEGLGPCPELARAWISEAPAWSTFPLFSHAFARATKGLKLSQEIGDRLREGIAHSFLAYCYYFVSSKLGTGIEHGHKAVQLLLGLGEYWDLSVGWVFLSMSYMVTGRAKDAMEVLEKYVATMKSVGSYQTLAWGLLQRSKAKMYLGQIDDSIIGDLKEGIRLCRETKDNPNLLNTIAVLGLFYQKTGQYDKAVELADETIKLFPTHFNKGSWSLEVFPIAAEVYLQKIMHTDGLPLADRNKYLKKAKYCCGAAVSWSQKYDIFRGWSLQVNGTYLWLTGKKKSAIKTWDGGIKFLREKTEDKYRLAYALLEQAKFLLQDNPQDKKALTNLLEAKELFAGMGCKLDLNTCNELLSKIMPQGEAMEGREALTQRRHLESLLSTTRAIGSVFVLDELLNKIMDYAIQVTGAERGFLLLYDDKTGQLNLKLSHGAAASDSFSFESRKISLELIHEAEKQKDTIIASSEQSVNPKIQTELKNYSTKQALAAYLTSRDKPIGILYLDNQLAGGTFGKQELELMQSFAVQASVSLENARLVSDLLDQARLRQEMELGREIQMDLLPKVTPTIDGLKVTGIMLPAKEIGGDYYDFLPNPSLDQLSIVIGDVSGKGVAAGLLMAMVKTCLYALNKQPISPRDILLATNQMLYEHINAKKFMTMLYLTWNAKERKLSYSSAGHEHILIYRSNPASTGVVEAILSGGFMLGMVPEIDKFLEDKTLDLKPGDKVILYTDGVTEARNPSEELFSLQRLTDIISKEGHKPTNELLDAVRQGVYSFIGTREQYDDITLVVMEAV